jgi:hypothetical protein
MTWLRSDGERWNTVKQHCHVILLEEEIGMYLIGASGCRRLPASENFGGRRSKRALVWNMYMEVQSSCDQQIFYGPEYKPNHNF